MTPEERYYLLESLMMLTNWKKFIGEPAIRETFSVMEYEVDKVWRYDVRLWDGWPGGVARGLYLKDNYKPVINFDYIAQSVSVGIAEKDGNDALKEIITQQWGKI
jgi:hypothetical protein